MDITTCIWFDDRAQEAAEFWCSVIPGARITQLSHYPAEGEDAPRVLMVVLDLCGHMVQLLNGGPQYPLSELVSLSISVDGQDELDRVWDALLAGGGEAGRCGWLKDRFGMSWQVVPVQLGELMAAGGEAAGRVGAAMMQMGRLDVGALEVAARG